MNKKPHFKDQVTSDRPPSRDPDGRPLLDADDATRAATVSGEASTVVADTVVEPSPIPSNNNNILEGDVSVRILPLSTRTLAENPNPSLQSATSATLIPIAFVVPDANAADTLTGNVQHNDSIPSTPTHRDHRQNRFALVLASLTVIAVAGIVAGAVCGNGTCGGGTLSTASEPEAAPIMAPSFGITTPSPSDRTTLFPVTTPTSASPTKVYVPTPAPLPVVSPAPTMRDRAEAITNFINSKSYTGIDLSLSGTLPEERAMQWLINDDPLQLNVGGDEGDEFRLLQRYSLLTLWFQADTGTAWTKSTNWTNADECTWHRIGCNKAGTVQRVLLSYLGLQGTLSPDLGLLTDLTRLQLDNNGLSGSLPTEIGLWASLTAVIVSSNVLTGSLPSEIVSWTKLTDFSFSSNDLKGSLPSEIGLWTSLQRFDVSGNGLTGSLPSEIGLWTSLTYFDVSHNGLKGSLPTEIGLWTSLTDFDVSLNIVIGSLPTEIGLWTSFTSFLGYGNSLTGSLPLEIGLWTNMTYFYVSGNSLTGTIPETIANWTLIEDAYFHFNDFSGSMPDGICEFISEADGLWADCVTNLECSCCTTCF